MQNKSIRQRLENWGKWATARARRGPDSMTGAICERLRKAALGNVWSGHDVHDPFDEDDALRIEFAWRTLGMPHKQILWASFIGNQPPEMICRQLRMPARPIAIFLQAFDNSQQEIAKVLDKMADFAKIPSNNLTPGKAETANQGRTVAQNESPID
jgi:hypothetical protein